MNGIGIVGTLAGLDRFLAGAHDLLRPHGQILFDSADLREQQQPASATHPRAYAGEVVFRLSYRSLVGTAYPWLFVDPETLRQAQENPEAYRSLVVRVAGYSAYFTELDEELQDEIIRRTEFSVT